MKLKPGSLVRLILALLMIASLTSIFVHRSSSSSSAEIGPTPSEIESAMKLLLRTQDWDGEIYTAPATQPTQNY